MEKCLISNYKDVVRIYLDQFANISHTFPVVNENLAYPITFFGQINTAELLTIAINPSPSEYHERRFPLVSKDQFFKIAGEEDLLDDFSKLQINRQLKYFCESEPTEFFKLLLKDNGTDIDYDWYLTGKAAHVDIVFPFATKLPYPYGQKDPFGQANRKSLSIDDTRKPANKTLNAHLQFLNSLFDLFSYCQNIKVLMQLGAQANTAFRLLPDPLFKNYKIEDYEISKEGCLTEGEMKIEKIMYNEKIITSVYLGGGTFFDKPVISNLHYEFLKKAWDY